MRHLLAHTGLICLCIIYCNAAFANQRPVLGAGHAFDRDYSFLSDPATRPEPLDGIKYVPLGGDSSNYLSVGGELRERYEGFINNPLFGINTNQSDHYLLHRALLHGDLHLQDFRAFLQLGHHDAYSKEGTVNPTERSGFDIQQAFAQYSHGGAWLRAGRQEIAFGSQRLVGFREGPNIRQSYDGIRLHYESGGLISDLFISRPTEIQPDDFDDSADDNQLFWGAHVTAPLTKNDFADIYYFKLDRDRARFGQGVDDERRDSVGTRLWNRGKPLDYNLEFVYQFGEFGRRDVSAWTASSDTGYSPAGAAWKARFGVKSSIATGDSNPADGKLGTFNPLFPRGAFFTENALVGPANFFDVQPSITLRPTPSITLTPSAHFLWRYDTSDAVYRQPNIPVAGTAGKSGRYTGTQWQMLANWRATSHIEVNAAYVHFAVGDAIKAAGGGDSDYLSSWVSFRF